VAAGESLLDPEMVLAATDDAGLTARELDVLTLMADGRNNAQIAASLFVSENTVKTHVRRIFDKLGSRDRAAAVLQAWKRHVI